MKCSSCANDTSTPDAQCFRCRMNHVSPRDVVADVNDLRLARLVMRVADHGDLMSPETRLEFDGALRSLAADVESLRKPDLDWPRGGKPTLVFPDERAA